jgi:plastocyanin
VRQRPRAATKPSISWALIPALAAGVLALAGCGSSSSSSSASTPATTASASSATTASTPAAAPSTGASSTLSEAANPEGQLKYENPTLSATTGKVSIDFTNASPVEHNLTVESSAGKVEGSTPTFKGGSKAVTLNLKPGTYKFFCTIPGHRMAGMEGTLTVK